MLENVESSSGIGGSTNINNNTIADVSNKANPVTILVPHLNLETNNCTFSQIHKYIDQIKQIYKEKTQSPTSTISLLETNSSTKENSVDNFE